MKAHRLMVVLLAVLINTGFAASALAQANNGSRKTAAEGEAVWVIVNYVKPDKRTQFERFVHEVFWPQSEKLDEQGKRIFRQTRVLHGAEPEEDGTYAYIFLMDPVIVGADYGIENLLRKMYPKAKAEEYFKMFEESLAKDYKGYTMLQSRH